MRRLVLIAAMALAGALFVAPSTPARAVAADGGVIATPSVAASAASSVPVSATPVWMLPLHNADGDVVILIPGTTDYDGADQLGRTRDIGLFGTDPADRPAIRIVDYPGAFGFRIGRFPVDLVGEGTYNDSVDIGTRKAVAAVEAAYDPTKPDQKIVINGYSQSAPVAMNAALMIKDRGNVPLDRIVVVIGADSRFPNTGVENVLPSFVPGLYTNGDRDAADLDGIQVYSYCVRGDSACGIGNPLVHPVATIFYLLPGFYLHGSLNDQINEYEIVREWDDGSTHYVVYDGGNPWGMMLRDLGIPVPEEVDDIVDALIPVPMPGEQATIAGHPVPTPRELQVALYAVFGARVPVTDPDVDSDTRASMADEHTPDDSIPATEPGPGVAVIAGRSTPVAEATPPDPAASDGGGATETDPADSPDAEAEPDVESESGDGADSERALDSDPTDANPTESNPTESNPTETNPTESNPGPADADAGTGHRAGSGADTDADGGDGSDGDGGDSSDSD
ncbi:PE-PPE domain-containing protein [Gordonia sp. ABSL1-1]|uniref:cutinase family protein n=1 Tax=Gordonia sp. ABSL1-1 TaxID=3053923 RepID=UPI0025748917|nr:PE-PPE domain-containing protein [Gordonia sp. ABSL1-1]MDL9935210.1 PE-PPE domain-containing protein [Gordonia sp. ABSL1-1]